LLQFYDALGEPEEEFLRLLPGSFDFQTLADEGVAVPLMHEPLIGKIKKKNQEPSTRNSSVLSETFNIYTTLNLIAEWLNVIML